MMGLAGCMKPKPAGMQAAAGAPTLPMYDMPTGPILPIRADVDRIFRITVCLRPFRAQGPRLDVETVGDKIVVYNYGHGGSGWSLSWGSAQVVVGKALEAAAGSGEVAVIGCGAMGLTSALTAQRAGLKVTIYAKERSPYTRSSRATGSWTPDSRISLASAAPPEFAAQWESMARASFAMYQSFLGMPGSPIEWTDRYQLTDEDRSGTQGRRRTEGVHDFAHYNSRIADLTPKAQLMPPGSTPFPTKYVYRNTSMTFNVADYSRQLLNDFLVAGGKIETRQFHTPQEFSSLPQKVIISCTGYDSRKLWSDESIVPVRGQIAWLIPQEGVNYGINYGDLNVLARRDGIVVQPGPGGEDFGWNDTNETPDRKAAEDGVKELQELYSRMEKKRV
jgi:glycine/D-amino acid oxidase-like deaminating enzyme